MCMYVCVCVCVWVWVWVSEWVYFRHENKCVKINSSSRLIVHFFDWAGKWKYIGSKSCRENCKWSRVNGKLNYQLKFILFDFSPVTASTRVTQMEGREGNEGTHKKKHSMGRWVTVNPVLDWDSSKQEVHKSICNEWQRSKEGKKQTCTSKYESEAGRTQRFT